MGAELFIDTSAWFALADRRIAGHAKVERALRERLQQGARIVTTNLIVAETHVLLLRRASHSAALAFLTSVAVVPTVVVSSTPALEKAARVDWLARYQDQSFSFTDAVSFAVMTDRRIREALTLDHHFSVAGFGVVPG